MSVDANDVEKRIRRLFAGQRLGVLATSGDSWPYATLVGLAVSDDLRRVFFATNRETRKFGDIMRDPHVSILVDDRRNSAADFAEAAALTAMGNAIEVTGDGRAAEAARYLARHPHMAAFLADPSVAFVRVAVVRYVLVTRFQEVVEWEP
ncbi:MAG: pyridoxamine 5'-phosphate oxidase family protein [Candidatus Krumholzibacteriota bacterium]|nr:pyridoxamine 5'-phosphate oxidase family protein [Candidatus Krumholzibacteriota bacterium]